MKNPKKPTRAQKILISTYRRRYDINNWLVISDAKDTLTIIHRFTGKTDVINKEVIL